MIPIWLQVLLMFVALTIGYIFGKTDRQAEKKRYMTGMPRRWGWPESTPARKLRGRYECEFCGVDADTWCNDDCEALDPFDWR